MPLPKNKRIYAIENETIMRKWDYEENSKEGLDPSKLTQGSHAKAHFICPDCKNKWISSIRDAGKYNGCQVCMKKARIISNIKTKLKNTVPLFVSNPELEKEWDYKENSKLGITPQAVTKGSNILAYWICPFGHQYTKKIKERCSGHGCVICAKESQTSFPEQAIYYYISKIFPDVKNRYGNPEIDIFIPSLNFGIEYDGFFSHKNKKDKEVLKDKIIQDKGINLIRIKEVNKIEKDNKNIIYCKPNSNNTFMDEVIIKIEKIINTIYSLNINLKPNIEKDRIKIEEQYISLKKENSIVDKRPDIAKEWDYNKNGSIKPEYILCGNSRKYFWICPQGHSYQASPNHRCHGTNCPYCALKKFKTGINDIKTLYPFVIEDWDYRLNSKKPEEEIAVLSHKFYWICPKGHSYYATLKAKLKKSKCTICSGKEILIGYNDLKTVSPELVEEWDYEKNKKMPENYTFLSNQKVYWVCKKCGYKWEAIINNRPNCPKCQKAFSLINVYSLETGKLINSYNGIVELCKKMKINYKKQRGNITSICNRKQKTLMNKYVLRYQKDDEFINIDNNEERLKKILNYLKK